MRSATRVLLGALAFVLVGGTASAQNDVTFQVDMNPYITTCQFDPAANGVTSPGDMNGWNTAEFPLADGDGDGVYTGTFSLPEGPINYKHFVTNSAVLSWENDPNRSYTVTAGAQTIPSSAFNGPTPTDACGGTEQDYTLTFVVDMAVQIGRGAFDPATQRVGVTGVVNGWNAADAWYLSEDSGTSGLYAGSVDVSLLAPSPYQFKFIITDLAGTTIASWENVDPAITPDTEGGNRVIRLTGTETDTDGDGDLDYFYDNNTDPENFPYFSDQDASQFLAGPATVTFNVDARSAQYLLAASGSLPGGATSIDRLAINGPAAGESTQDGGPGGGIGDWAGWGDVLDNLAERQLTNGGNNQWSITLNYAAGARRNMVAKFGILGQDNESGFGGDHQFSITEGANTVTLSFGCIRRNDVIPGRFGYTDETGGNPPTFTSYDEYLLIRNDNNPATCVTVTSGGVTGDVQTVSVENGPTIAGLDLVARPNPVASRGTLDLTLERAMDVRVALFDVTGREVATLAEGALAAGTTSVDLDATGLSAGVYVLRVEADGQTATRRLTVVR